MNWLNRTSWSIWSRLIRTSIIRRHSIWISITLLFAATLTFRFLHDRQTYQSVTVLRQITGTKIASESQDFFAFSPNRGVIHLTADLKEQRVIPPIIASFGSMVCNASGSIVYMTEGWFERPGRFAAFDVASGDRRWEFNVEGLAIGLFLSSDDTILWIVAHDGVSDFGWGGYCAALNPSDGTIICDFLIDDIMPIQIVGNSQKAIVLLRNGDVIPLQIAADNHTVNLNRESKRITTEVVMFDCNGDDVYGYSAKRRCFVHFKLDESNPITMIPYSDPKTTCFAVDKKSQLWVANRSTVKCLQVVNGQTIEKKKIRCPVVEFDVSENIVLGTDGQARVILCNVE